MFTGIVAAVGKIAQAVPALGGLRLRVDAGSMRLDDVAVGDSIAVDGVCLTVIALHAAAFDADVSGETLACSAGFALGASVNLEKALRLSDRLGGHLVSGHVDGVGKVARCEAVGDNRMLGVSVPHGLAKFIARKGSVTVHGVSLTVNDVTEDEFTVNLIPHTLQATSLKLLKTGDRVNLETDMVARYAERLRQFDT